MKLSKLLYSSQDDQPGLAVTVMLIGLLALSLQDSFSKILTAHLSLWQFQTIRAALNISVVLVLARVTMRGFTLLPKAWGPVMARSAVHVCALMFFFGSAPFITMAEMAGGLYTFPLFVAALSAIFLKEHVGLRRIMGIAIGFIGTLMIIKPGTESFRLVGLLPVGAGFSYAWYIIITRRYLKGESPVVLTLVSNVSIFVCGAVGLLIMLWIQPASDLQEKYPLILTAWFPMLPWMMLLITITTMFNVLGNICMSKAYQSAEASFLAPFDYSYLVYASIWGYVFWRDIPSWITILGMILIAGGGIFVAWRERQANKLKVI